MQIEVAWSDDIISLVYIDYLYITGFRGWEAQQSTPHCWFLVPP
jgi:hypothetical protein